MVTKLGVKMMLTNAAPLSHSYYPLPFGIESN